ESGEPYEVRFCRPDLNNPPTAVGGIPDGSRSCTFCRPDLKYPPTAVGGISEHFCKAHGINFNNFRSSRARSLMISVLHHDRLRPGHRSIAPTRLDATTTSHPDR